MSTLHITLFGSLSVKFEDLSGEVKLTRSVQELLAYLLLYRNRAHPRDILAGLFWGEQSQEKARNSLNTALWRLRSILEPYGSKSNHYVISDPSGEVLFNSNSAYWLDVAIFEHQVERTLKIPVDRVDEKEIEQLRQALELYTGELLESFYDDWALRERERMRALYLNSQAYLLKYFQKKGFYDLGLASGQRILEIDPLREEIHREMIQIYQANGQRALAIRQYETCCRVLQIELGIEPMEETQALFKQILVASRELPSPNSQVQVREALAQLRQAAMAAGNLQTQLWAAIETFENHLQNQEK